MNHLRHCIAALVAAAAVSVAAAETPPSTPEDTPRPDLGSLPQERELLRRVRLCGPPLAPAPDAATRERRSHPDTPVVLKAEEIFADAPLALYRLSGSAELRRLDQRLRAERLNLDEADGNAQVPGQFTYTEGGLHLWGEAGRFNLAEERMAVERTAFRLYPHAHGAARRLSSDGAATTRLEDLRYSTCPPGEELWWLHAGTLELDHEAGVGRAHHARLEIGGIPWLYTPYLQFPIDDRPRTGVLPPSFGQSESDGTRLAVPVYVRLAPNYDLTLTPTYYSRRGLQLAAEGRYLHRSQEGELEVSYLPDDEAYTERLRERGEAGTEADRWALSWRHDGDLPADIDYRLDVERVGDKDHLRDFSSDLAGSSDAELESRALARQSLGNHRWEAEAQHWQNLRPESRSDPYRRWPAVRYTHTPGPLAGGVHYTLEGEAVHFDLPQGAAGSGDDERPTGRRYHLQPRLAWPVQEQAFFVEPAVSLHHTEYDLTRPAGSPRAERLSRTVPIASLDAGLFLERPFTLGSRPLLQTLEPRLFYLYAPHREQSAFPNFDTSERGNTVAQLFQENRFSGIDRIGDAHQVTAALTTRVLDIAEGTEPLRASIGQVYHLDEREVTLSGDPADDPRLTRGRSDLFADAQAQLPGGLRLRGEYRYDPYREARAATTFDADWQYRPAAGALVNLGYRLREETTTEDGERVLETTQELVEASTAVPLNERWRAVGAWQRSLLEPSTLELVGGVEYRQCCWAARGLFRRYRRGAEQQIENTFMVEFELTGLGRLGQDTAAFLRDVVPDYGKTVF